MSSWLRRRIAALVWVSTLSSSVLLAQTPKPSGSSSSKISKPATVINGGVVAGAVLDSVYRNKSLALSCKIPAGWVLRTEEMNAPDENAPAPPNQGDMKAASASPPRGGCPSACNIVLLAAFSRPPEAAGQEVNASILIAAESVAAYPGLKQAEQYFGPLTEVAKAQGFIAEEDPYQFAVGTKTVVRGDFRKNVGTRLMRQSTLAWLDRGYALSITVIGGTEDEVEGLVDGIEFGK